MKKLLILLLASSFYITSCSSVDYTEKRVMTFQSNLDVQSFFAMAQDAFKIADFAVVKSDNEEGLFRAIKSATDDFNMDILINYNKDSQGVDITIVNRIVNGSANTIEYYTLDVYNDNYKKDFFDAIQSLKVNSTKTTFPNR
jgi:hypothetical protein